MAMSIPRARARSSTATWAILLKQFPALVRCAHGPLGPRPRSTLCEDMNCCLSARPLTRVRVAMGVRLRVPPTPWLCAACSC